MAKFHIVAAMRAVDVVVFYESPAERAPVSVRRFPIEECRRQRDHQQTDDCLPHDNCSCV
jgi:hypothetical protein